MKINGCSALMIHARRPLVLAVYEPRWFRRVMNILNDRGVTYRHYYTPEELPPYSVLYTDYEYFLEETRARGDVHVVYDPGRTCRGLEEAVLASMNKRYYNQVTIGIDPGPTPYYLVLGDGSILSHGRISWEDLIPLLDEAIECYPAALRRIRIGSGYKGALIAYEIASIIRDASVELVDERRTTPKNRGGAEAGPLHESLKPYRNKDAYAALRIALRRGIEVREA